MSYSGGDTAVTHQAHSNDMLELATLYALGVLPSAQAATFEAHLHQGCPVCQQELDAMAATVGALGHAALLVRPRQALRARLFASIRSEGADSPAFGASTASTAETQKALGTIIRAAEGVWVAAAGVDGIWLKALFREQATGHLTALVRMEGGRRYPPHRHVDTEELYIVAGDLRVDTQALGPGDYCAATAGSMHGSAHSNDGCTFILVTTAPEVFPDTPDTAGSGQGLIFVRASEGDWRDGPTPGTAVRPISSDAARHTMTALVRMQAGASLPRHRHLTTEQFFMLEGDGHVPGHVLGPGDYYRMPAGSLHDTTYTEGGCVFLLIASRVEILG